MTLRFLLSISLLFSIASCVSSKKYKQLESENANKSTRIERLEEARIAGELAAANLRECTSTLLATQSLLNDMNSRYNGLMESFNFIEKNYEEVLLQNAELLDVTSKEKKELTEEINRKQEEFNEQARLLEERQAKIQESEDRINELTNTLDSEKRKMDSLQTSVSNALFVFGPADLSVEQKNGKIYISLSQKLLFSKGSDVIDSQGKNALNKLADVLKERADFDIIVEGHTDSDGNPDTNWDLSTKRATAVVKFLQQSGVNPEHLTASGRSFYEPIAENDSEDNKSKNRRTEIIISPKLDEIMQLIRPN